MNNFLNLITKAHAQIGTISQLPGTITIGEIFARIVSWALYLGGGVAVIYLIYGGFAYITSAGDTSKAEVAKQTITYAIIGVVVIALAIGIVTWVEMWIGGTDPNIP